MLKHKMRKIVDRKIMALVLVGIVTLSLGIILAQAGLGSERSVVIPVIPAAKNANVTPTEGNWDDSFDYSVDVSYYNLTEIELWIYHPAEHDWIFRGTREYNATGGKWQTLWWNERPFDRNCEGESSSYKFVWTGTILKIGGKERLFGPRIIINESLPWVEFGNETVSCRGNATYKSDFNYSIEVNASKTIDIELMVYDPCLGIWTSVEGHTTYSSAEGGWQTLTTWNNTKPFLRTKCKERLAKFRFKACREEICTFSPEYDGPYLMPLIKFKNAKVEPESGKYNTSFNYSVEFFNKTEHVDIDKIKLMVWNPHTGREEEISPENVTNQTNSMKKWSAKPFVDDPNCEGEAGYYFTYNGDRWPETGQRVGPAINLSSLTPTPAPHGYGGGGGGGGGGFSYKPYMLYENANVEPPDCILKGAIERKTFDYTVEVDKKDILILEIYNPSSNEWEEKGEGEKSELKGEWGKWKHEWTINLTLDKNWAGLCKYRFYPERWEKYASQVYYGPEIKMLSLSEWKEEIGFSDKVLEEPTITSTVNPPAEKWFKKFTYTAEINHPDRANMTVVLFVYKPGSNNWEPVPWRGDRFNPIINPSDYNERNSATVKLDSGEERGV